MQIVSENQVIMGGSERCSYRPNQFNLKGRSFQIMPETEYLIIDHLPLKRIVHFFSQIMVNEATGCWNWIGPLRDGYGLCKHQGRTEGIHRVLYAWAVGPLPRGFQARRYAQLDHICRNRQCCNPVHLELVSQRENVLRGTSPPAINVVKTHCDKGHPLRTAPRGKRYCGECDSQKHKDRMNGPRREYWLEKNRQNVARYNQKRRDA